MEIDTETGQPLKFPIPKKLQNECDHNCIHFSYPFNMMKAPVCGDCGKPQENYDFTFYQSLLDDYNKNAFFKFTKNSDGIYSKKYNEKHEKHENMLTIIIDFLKSVKNIKI